MCYNEVNITFNPQRKEIFMKFTLLQKINNIVLQSGSGERKLNDEERKIIFPESEKDTFICNISLLQKAYLLNITYKLRRN